MAGSALPRPPLIGINAASKRVTDRIPATNDSLKVLQVALAVGGLTVATQGAGIAYMGHTIGWNTFAALVAEELAAMSPWLALGLV